MRAVNKMPNSTIATTNTSPTPIRTTCTGNRSVPTSSSAASVSCFAVGVGVGASISPSSSSTGALGGGVRVDSPGLGAKATQPALAKYTSGQTLACVPRTEIGSARSEEHTSELQSRGHLVCRLLLE